MARILIITIAAVLSGLFLWMPMPAEAAGELVQPPAIHMPFNSKTKLEINFSDSDVLGIVRELLPTIGDLIKTAAGTGSPVSPQTVPVPPEILAKIDLKPLSEALEGVTNVRVIVARYKPGLPADGVMSLFDSGAAKAGDFAKVISNLSVEPRVLAIYSRPAGAGFLVYIYDGREGTIHAARLSGRIDVAKILTWVSETAKLFMTAPAPAVEPKTEPLPDTSQPNEENS